MAIRPMAKRKRSEHYVNNKEFLAALLTYRENVEIARLQDKPKPVIPRYDPRHISGHPNKKETERIANQLFNFIEKNNGI